MPLKPCNEVNKVAEHAREGPEALDPLDKLRTFSEAAALSGLKYSAVQRAAKRGFLKTYSLGTSKKYVTLRDIFAAASK